MNDDELYKYLRENNYSLTHKQYKYVCQMCTQINHVEFINDRFVAWSDNGNRFNFEVYYEY